MRLHRHVFDQHSVEQEPDAHLESRGVVTDDAEPHFIIISRNPGDFETIELIVDHDYARGLQAQLNTFINRVRDQRDRRERTYNSAADELYPHPTPQPGVSMQQFVSTGLYTAENTTPQPVWVSYEGGAGGGSGGSGGAAYPSTFPIDTDGVTTSQQVQPANSYGRRVGAVVVNTSAGASTEF